MSYLLFAPDDVKALAPQVVPDRDDCVFDYAARSAILSAASDLSRETYVWTAEAIGEGTLCFPLWKRDQDTRPNLERACDDALLLSAELVAHALARCA